MNGQRPEPEMLEPKKELEKARIQLHNAEFSIQVLKAQVKKLEEMAR